MFKTFLKSFLFSFIVCTAIIGTSSLLLTLLEASPAITSIVIICAGTLAGGIVAGTVIRKDF